MKMLRRSVPFLAVSAIVAASLALTSTSGAQGPPDGFSLPAQAQKVAPGVYFLGAGVDKGVPVVGYAYEHHRPGHAAGPGGGGGEDPPADASSCYSFIANGARWRSPEAVTVDPDNSLGVSFGAIQSWMEKWETALGGDIYEAFHAADGPLSADGTSTDGLNEVYFGAIADEGVLGYTIVWSSRAGPPSSRGIVEADMVIDPDWPWQVAVEATTEGVSSIDDDRFDLTAVFAHEAGHYVGLGHTATTAECEGQTMFPSLADGDDRKQSLDVGDINGVIDLYT